MKTFEFSMFAAIPSVGVDDDGHTVLFAYGTLLVLGELKDYQEAVEEQGDCNCTVNLVLHATVALGGTKMVIPFCLEPQQAIDIADQLKANGELQLQRLNERSPVWGKKRG